MNDNDVLDRVLASVSGLRMDTPVEEIHARARARRRRRVSRVAGVGTAAGVALTAVLLAIDASGRSASPAPPATSQLAAFTVVSGPNGSATMTLRKGAPYRLDPEALRQALALHGIPAVVNVGRMCDTDPEVSGLDRVVSSRRVADGSVFTRFDPAAMPAGSAISIGYFPTKTSFSLIEDGAALHCSTEPGAPTGAGPGAHSPPRPAGETTTP